MVKFMKKNNKYRSSNNYNNQIYSLNYKFDSISPAGKISGTALDLIKKYNELAKEAQGNADYVEAENFRQYAEHYRKIVTEINERKNQRINFQNKEEGTVSTSQENVSPVVEIETTSISSEANSNDVVEAQVVEEKVVKAPKRQFKIIEVNAEDSEKPVSAVRSRTRTTRKTKVEAVAQ